MRWFIALTLLVSLAAQADTYRWVDENGVVNYSDTYHPGAERVDLGSIETTSFSTPPPESGAQTDTQEEDSGGSYDSVTIQRPQPEETLWNLEGLLDVQVSVQPRIRPGDRLTLFLDGQPVVGVPAGATSFTIDKVYRGMHTLRAAVQGSGGRELGSSQTVRFYVQQTSVANPPSGPRPSPRPRG